MVKALMGKATVWPPKDATMDHSDSPPPNSTSTAHREPLVAAGGLWQRMQCGTVMRQLMRP